MIGSIKKFRLPMALFGATLAISTLVAGPAKAEGELVVRDFVLTNAVVGREPKQIDVHQRHGPAMRQTDVERGATDAVGSMQLHAATERARERGLARTHRTLEKHHRPRRHQRPERFAERFELWLFQTALLHCERSVPPP